MNTLFTLKYSTNHQECTPYLQKKQINFNDLMQVSTRIEIVESDKFLRYLVDINGKNESYEAITSQDKKTQYGSTVIGKFSCVGFDIRQIKNLERIIICGGFADAIYLNKATQIPVACVTGDSVIQHATKSIRKINPKIHITAVVDNDLSGHKTASKLSGVDLISCTRTHKDSSDVALELGCDVLTEQFEQPYAPIICKFSDKGLSDLKIEKLEASLLSANDFQRKADIINQLALKQLWRVGWVWTVHEYKEYLFSRTNPWDVNRGTIKKIIESHNFYTVSEAAKMNQKFTQLSEPCLHNDQNNELDLDDVLNHIDSDCTYDEWVQVGQGIHHYTGGAGFHYFDSWSQLSPEYKNRDCRQQWGYFGRGTGNQIKIGTLIHLAKSNGYYVPSRAKSQNMNYTMSRVEAGYTLSERDIETHNTIFLNWSMGSGKTQRGGKPFADFASKNDYQLIATTHRKSLISELANRLKLTHYQDLNILNVCTVRGLAVCVPSIVTDSVQTVLRKSKKTCLFIDEFEQVLDFLEEPECSAAEKSHTEVKMELINLIKTCDKLLIADAHLSDRAKNLIERERGDKIHLLHHKTKQSGNVETYLTTKDAELETVEKHVKKHPVWIAVDAITKGKLIHKHLCRRGLDLDKKIIRIDKETVDKARVKKFLENASEESLKYDVVIASPIISSGLSIEHEEPHFKEVFVFSCGKSVPYLDLLQMMRRVRYVKQYHVFFSRMAQAGIQKEQEILTAVEKVYEEVTAQDGLRAQKMERQNYGKSKLPLLMCQYLKDEGYNVNYNPLYGLNEDEEIKELIKLIRDEDIAGILAARDITKHDSNPTHHELMRYNISKAFRYQEDITEKLIKEYRSGLHRKLHRLYLLNSGKNRMFERHQQYLKKIFKYKTDIALDKRTAKRYLDKIIEHRSELCLFGLIPQVAKYSKARPPKIKDIQGEVKKAFEHNGFVFERVQRNNEKIYVINAEKQEKMLERAIKHGSAKNLF